MTNFTSGLKPFVRRVRTVRSWRGFAYGACVGSGLASVWAGLDYLGLFYAEAPSLAALIGFSGLLGALVGYVRSVSATDLAASIDRRSGLADRLSSALESADGSEGFSAALQADAEQKLAQLRPSVVFPFRVDRLQGGALALTALAASLFLLGNTPLLLNEKAKEQRAELKQAGQKVERITKEAFETPEAQAELNDAERRLAAEMNKLQRDLKKARISKEEAFQRQNELGKKADELLRQRAAETQKSLETAQSALEKLQEAALKKAGLESVTPQMAQMGEIQRADAMAEAQRQSSKLAEQIASLESKLSQPNKSGITPSQQAKSDAERREMQKQLDQLKGQLKKSKANEQALKLSAEAQKTLQAMMETPEWKELQELAKKLQAAAKAGAQGEQTPLTDAERKEMLRKFEELMKKLQDKDAMREYLKALKEALKNGNQMCKNGKCAGIGLGQGLGVGFDQMNGLPGMNGMPGASHEIDTMTNDTGRINKSEAGNPGVGKAQPTWAPTQRREGPGAESYVEIKAPTTIGNRSSVPYTKVLPSYRQKAETALDRQQIPKQHEKRVKEYFESLGK